MSNIYHDNLESLRRMSKGPLPAVSMYVPLKWSDYHHGKIYTALVKAADNLLVKEGLAKLSINSPDWDRWIKQGTVTLGIFHSAGMTSFIPLPMRMQPRVIVANSFHIKPIITAANEYIDGLLLHFHETGASLFRINPANETLIDSYLPSEILPKTDWPNRIDRASLREYLEFLMQEMRGNIQHTTKIVAVTGSAFPQLQSESFWKKINMPIFFYHDSFRTKLPHNAFSIMRLRLSQIINKTHTESVLHALQNTSLENIPSVNHLSSMILNKQIKHLCVSLDDLHFGEINSQTGNIVLNKSQMNSKDDDLLDDLVELAIDNGINVSVVPKKYLPTGRSFIAS